jgi:N-acetylneuraminate synthase
MNQEPEFNIGTFKVGGNNPTFFIADIAANHDGDLNRAKDLIYLAKESGADAAKFQHFSAETIVSDHGFKNLGNHQSSHQSKWKKSVYEVYKDASVNLDWTPELKKCCDDVGIIFMTTPYDFSLVDHIDPYVPAYKIGSGDITWIEMLSYVASKNKPLLIATGASSAEDVTRAMNAVSRSNSGLAILQCNTNYTGSVDNFQNINLNVLKWYKSAFPNAVLGLSDHTPGDVTVLGAVALGARIIEKHFTDNNARSGPDHGFSMNPAEWKAMVERVRLMEFAFGSGVKVVESNEKETVILQRRSLRLAKDKALNDTLDSSDVIALRPCVQGEIEPYHIDKIIGARLLRPLKVGESLRWEDLG